MGFENKNRPFWQHRLEKQPFHFDFRKKLGLAVIASGGCAFAGLLGRSGDRKGKPWQRIFKLPLPTIGGAQLWNRS